MTAVYDLIAPRVQEDVARLYVEARCAGLEVSHYQSHECRVFDGSPGIGCSLGVFRNVGSLIWWKQERRWEVRACTDAGPVDLATLIVTGLAAVDEYGRSPGYYTRNRVFRHVVSSRSGREGKAIATAGVAYQLNADDLLASESAAVSMPTPVDVSALLGASG